MRTKQSPAAWEALRGQFKGKLLSPGEAAYDEARTLFNAMIDKRPAVIAQCTDAADVAAAIRYAREAGLPIAVRAGGHSVAGQSLVDDGVVIDVRPINHTSVDPGARTITVGSGVTWGMFDRATEPHGLLTTGGRVSSTGVAGLTLGGGSGWLERAYGLACDNLVGAELVTADGRTVTASDTENPDLMWALRGGGGNFGVATSLTFKLHKLGPQILAGLLFWEAEKGQDVIRFVRDFMSAAPDEATVSVLYLHGPPEDFIPERLHGKLIVGAAVTYAGPVEQGEKVLRPVREYASPFVDLVEPTAYADFQCSIDDPPGMRNYWTADYLSELSNACIDTFVENSLKMTAPAGQSIIFPWGGAVARNAAGSAMAQRDAGWVTHPFMLWDDPAQDDEHMAFGRAFGQAMKPYANGGVYLNFIGEEGQDRIKAAFGDSYLRLQEVKAAFDPDNVFRGNQNIVPAGKG